MGTTIEEEQAVSRDYQGEDPVEQSNSSSNVNGLSPTYSVKPSINKHHLAENAR